MKELNPSDGLASNWGGLATHPAIRELDCKIKYSD